MRSALKLTLFRSSLMFVENFQVFQNMFVYAKILQPTKVQSSDKKSVSEKPHVASR